MENGFDNRDADYNERKNKTIYIIVTAIIVILASLLINNFQARKDVEKDICNVYYLDTSREFLKSEERYIWAAYDEVEILTEIEKHINDEDWIKSLNKYWEDNPERLKSGNYKDHTQILHLL